MSKTIANFLVGVGLETKDFEKGSHNVQAGLSRFRSLAGIAGTAIAGAFAISSLAAIRAGERIDRFNLSAEKFSTNTRFVYDYGNALKMLGGDASEAVGAIGAAEKALDNLRLKGELGAFQDAIFAGVDISQLTSAQNGEEFLRRLSAIVPDLGKDQQRLLQESFGFSDATMRSLREGSRQFDANIAKASSLAGEFDGATEAARAYNKQIAELNTRIEGFTNTLADKMLPGFTSILETFNNFLARNKNPIEDALSVAGASPTGTTAVAGGLAASATGAAASALGLAGTGAALSTLGPVGVIGGAGALLWNAKETEVYKRSRDAWIGDAKRPANAFPNTYVKGKGFVSPEEAAEYRKQESIMQSGSSSNSSTSTRPLEVKNNITLGVTMAGRPMEAFITEVIERREFDTMDDMRSTVSR